MHRLSVIAGAMCATMILTSIASGANTPDPQRMEESLPTWTLFLVTVFYKSGWSVTPVAAFKGTTSNDDKSTSAKDDCESAKSKLTAIRGVSASNAEAAKLEGNTEYLICLPATAPQSRSSDGPGSGQ